MEQLSYRLDVFEGPMDLLLHLISKHKLNIYDIPIMELVEQYISYVKKVQEADMYVASDFLEMAARLVYIKTVSLLPVYDEADDLKKELTVELLEYRDCKILAGELAQHTDGFNTFVREPTPVDVDPTYTRLHETEELIRAYINAVGRKMRRLPPPIDAFKGIVATKFVSVQSRLKSIFSKFKSHKAHSFSTFFEDATSRSDMVATFLALLELAKSKKIYVDGEGVNTNVRLLAENIEDFDTEAEEWE